jgi:hypothetical protein
MTVPSIRRPEKRPGEGGGDPKGRTVTGRPGYCGADEDSDVLDVGDTPVAERSAELGVTLLASDAVPVAALDALAGRHVRVTGEYIKAQPAKVDPTQQYPMGAGGQPLPRGAGFRALKLSPI